MINQQNNKTVNPDEKVANLDEKGLRNSMINQEFEKSRNQENQEQIMVQTIREGYKNTEVGVIPEDWECNDLQYYFSFISYGFTNPMPTVSEGIYMITANDVNEGRIKFETARKTTEEAYKYLLSDKSRPKKYDILLTKDGSLGRLAIVGDEKICINQSVAVIRPNDKVYPLFLKLLLEDTYYQRAMIDNAGGSTIKHIYITIVNKMKLGIPPTLTEQTAIATALSDADALISSLENLIAKKRNIKQGAMQKLLQPKEGWKTKTLKELTKYRRGSFPQPYGLDKWYDDTNGFPFVQVFDVDDNFRLKAETKRRISKEAQDMSVFIAKGSVIITLQGSIGRIAITQYDAYVDRTLLFFESFIVPFDKYFFLLSIFNLFEKEKEKAPGGIIKTITKEALSIFSISYPEIEEQTRIATILSDMDAEILALETKLEKYRKVKLGMMQNLLTGKIRLV